MNTKVDVFLGAPIEVESERRFLHALCGDLQARHQDALVLANFLLPPQKPIQQIDYLVISERLVCHIELTNLTAPVIGRVNGTWHLVLPDGTKKLHGNKYRQALDCKYRISDQMHCFARQHAAIVEPLNGVKFYRHIDSVVCVYPELMAGSRVPSDKFVRVQGYSDLLHHFANAEGKPAWSSNDWLLFAMELGLVRQDDFTQLPAESVAAAAELVDAYCQRFRDYYKRLTKRLVPTTLESGGAKTNSDECFGFLTMGRHGQLVGPSGSGKSLHAQHMALQSIDAGRVPIVVRAVHYAGKLSLLLDRSVAHLCPRTAVDFIECVRRLGKSLVLVVDGFNECPLRLQETLLRDLQSVFLRWEIPMVITTQEEISLPANLSGEVLRFCDLTEHERRAILVEHAQKELRPDIDFCPDPSSPLMSLASPLPAWKTSVQIRRGRVYSMPIFVVAAATRSTPLWHVDCCVKWLTSCVPDCNQVCR